MRKTLAAAQIARQDARDQRPGWTGRTSPDQMSVPLDRRRTITIGVVGGTYDSTRASSPLGSWASRGQAIIGMMKTSMIGIIRLCVSLIVLQTEPTPARIALNRTKPRM